MDNKNNTPGEEHSYADLGEKILHKQGLPPEAVPVQAGEPVRETPIPGDAPAKVATETAETTEVRTKGETLPAESEAPDSAAAKVTPPSETGTAPKAPTNPENTSAKPKLTETPLWQTMLRPIIALVAICLVTSLLLGLTNAATAPVIAANTAAAAEAARTALLPQADGFEAVQPPADLKTVTAMYRATNGVGWVVEAYGRGYGGQVPALVAFAEDGSIAGVTFAENSETVGLGQKVREPAFYEQFAERPAENLSLPDIDKIASATISSNAALGAVNAAIEAYQRETGGGSALPTTLEEALPTLLSGEELTAIQLDIPNVQPTAYVSSAGNYIIVGEKPSDDASRPSTVVAAVAMTPEGAIVNLWLDTSGEDYGKALATDTAFLGSFVGQSAPVQVDVVAGVTNSSTSVITAVNTALGALPLAKEAA